MINFESILMQAVGYQDKDLIRLLILYGANMDGYVTLDGREVTEMSFLQFAIHQIKDIELIEILTENGADINAVDDNGNTHLIIAIKERQEISGVCVDSFAS